MAALMKRQEDERVKQEEERKVKADGAERKRKERDEASGTSSQTSSVVKTKIVRPKAKVSPMVMFVGAETDGRV